MIEMDIPGRGVLRLEHLVFDVEGTLSIDGKFRDNLVRSLLNLKDRLTMHLITVDTYKKQDSIDRRLGVSAVRIQPGISEEGARDEIEQKTQLVKELGAQHVVAIGQGANDAGMLNEAALGICVLSPEGSAVETLLAADIVVPDISSALDILTKPLRIVTTLRK